MSFDAETPKLENMALAHSSGKHNRPGYEHVLNYEQNIEIKALQFGSKILHGLSDLLAPSAYGGELTDTQKAEKHYKIGKIHYNKN
jgi:hypothetical protein